MAWTSPRTWLSGETVTAAMLNTHVRDNLKAIGNPSTPYTPTWTCATGADPVIGNGSIAGSYTQAGKAVTFFIVVTAGSTTTFGGGNYRFTLPVTAANYVAVIAPAFQLTPTVPLMARGLSVTQINLYRNDTGVIVDNSSTSIASGSILTISGQYEAA